MKKVKWIAIETPIFGSSGEFFVYGLFKSEKKARKIKRRKNCGYDFIPLHDITKKELKKVVPPKWEKNKLYKEA